MKKILIISLVCIFAATGLCAADELVLETGKILSGRVTDLTEDTVSIVVNGNEIEISRVEVEAVFLGETLPFSTHGYPGVKTAGTSGQKDEK